MLPVIHLNTPKKYTFAKTFAFDMYSKTALVRGWLVREERIPTSQKL